MAKNEKMPTLADQDIVSRITTKTKKVVTSKKFLTVTVALGLTAASIGSCRLRSDSKAYCDYDTGYYADYSSCDSD